MPLPPPAIALTRLATKIFLHVRIKDHQYAGTQSLIQFVCIVSLKGGLALFGRCLWNSVPPSGCTCITGSCVIARSFKNSLRPIDRLCPIDNATYNSTNNCYQEDYLNKSQSKEQMAWRPLTKFAQSYIYCGTAPPPAGSNRMGRSFGIKLSYPHTLVKECLADGDSRHHCTRFE